MKPAYINIKVFDEWTRRNCWALGLLTADGTFGKKARPNQFNIYSTEISMLEAVKKVFESDKRIYINQGVKGRLGKKPVGQLAMSNPTIAKFLKSINAWGDKDERNPFPNVPDQFKWSFIKGLFDGDGNCYKGHFSIAGRLHLIEEVYNWICNQIEKTPNKIYTTTSSSRTVYFQLSKGDAEKVLRKIEQHSPDTYNSEKYNVLRNIHKATLGQLQYLARNTEYRDAALLELDRRIPR